MRINRTALIEHEPELDIYEPYIERCKGCDWRWDYREPNLTMWEAYVAHLVAAEEPVLWVWSPEHGAQRWYGSSLPPDPVEDERRLAGALEKLYSDREWLPNHIYFIATVTEVMG